MIPFRASLVIRRSLVLHFPFKVWEKVGEKVKQGFWACLSVTSQFTVVSRLNRAETRLTRLYLLEGSPFIGYYHRIPQLVQLEELSGIELNLSDLAFYDN